MLSAIISYLNGLLADTGYFSEVKGLSVLIKREGKTFPAYYCNGEYEPATNFDTEIGLCYWRFRSEPTDTTVEAPYQVNKILRRTYPLRLICAVMRDQLGNNDNAYAEDSLSLAIEKVIKDREREVRSEARALAAQILWRGVITSAETMKNTELLEIEASIQARMLFMGIDVDIVIDYQGNCINDFCGIKAPSNLVATPDSNSIDLTWTDNSDNETGFKVYRATNYTGPFSVIATKSAGSTSHSDTTATADIIYFYKVSAFNADAESFSGIVASVIASGSEAFDILNDKPTPQVILEDATSENNVITMQATLEVAAGNFTDDVSIPVPGTPLKLRLRDSVGGLFAMTLQPGPGYVAAEDRMYVDFADMVFNDFFGDFTGSMRPDSSILLIVLDENDNPVRLTDMDVIAGQVTLKIPGDPFIGIPLTKTGQTDDFGVSGTDGDFEEGDPFLTLRANNPFGHTFRFTGITGGYHDGTNYKDVNGATTTQVLAFPENIMLDWRQYDRDADPQTVRGYFIGFASISVAPWATQVTNALAFTTASFSSGWRLANERQGFELINRLANTAGDHMNYPPIFHDNTGTGTALWLSTQRGDVTTQAVLISQTWYGMATVNKTQSSRALYTRRFTLTELGL